MWLILGIIAMAMGLSFTALTLCVEHSLVSNWVKGEDWSVLRLK